MRVTRRCTHSQDRTLRWLLPIVTTMSLALTPGAVASDQGVKHNPVIASQPMLIAPPRPALPADVIDEALWERFARRNGPQWWLHAKTIKDADGHTQLNNARFIVRRFRDEGLPDSVALAAVANSLMESSLLSHRVHPVSKATGLFQTWRNPRQHHNMPGGGAGNGTQGFDWGDGLGKDATTAQMKDRELNVLRMIWEIRRVKNTSGKTFYGVAADTGFGDILLQRAADGATVAELSAIWGEQIERYRPNPGGTYRFRGRVAERLFGKVVLEDTSNWRQNPRPKVADCSAPSSFNGLGMDHRPSAFDPLTEEAWIFRGAPWGGTAWPLLSADLQRCP
ncbi:MAG: hypothetical protein ACI9MC_000519 [Kiritimatiellia bacterium]|jgi:hypothetical protein